MSVIIQIENPEGKRMCVYSQRDFEYMIGKGWFPHAPACPPAPLPATPLPNAADAPKKRPGRPAKVKH